MRNHGRGGTPPALVDDSSDALLRPHPQGGADTWYLWIDHSGSDVLTLDDAASAGAAALARVIGPRPGPQLIAILRAGAGPRWSAVYRGAGGRRLALSWSLDGSAAPVAALHGASGETTRIVLAPPRARDAAVDRGAVVALLPETGGDLGAPQYADDSFVVTIANQTSNLLSASSTHFDWGDFSDGSGASSILPNSTSTAFHVQGASGWPSGVQGTITYLVDTVTQLAILFNSNAGGSRGAYFYAALQPRATGQDPTAYYAQVSGFSPFDSGSTFTPTITLTSTSSGISVTPLPPIFELGYVMIDIWISNNTTEILTLENVICPLNSNWQPAFAQVIPPLTTTVLMTTYYMIKTTLSDMQVVYNLPGGTLVTFAMPVDANQPNGPLRPTFNGNQGVPFYATAPVETETYNGDGQVDSITFTLTLALGLPFVVQIANQTTSTLSGQSSNFSVGGLVPGTSLGAIGAGSTGLAFQAVGTVQPVSGVTGTVSFALPSSLTLTMQCQSNAGGAAGWYFYPGLSGTSADPTSVYVQVTGMPPLVAGGLQATFAPTVALAPAGGPIAPMPPATAPAGATATIINVMVDNQSGAIMTLAAVTSPLGVPWQPGFAPTIPNGTSSLLITAALVGVDLSSSIDVTYNLTGNTQVTMTLPANSSGSAPTAAVSGTFAGANPGGFTFAGQPPTSSTLGSVTTYTLDVTITAAAS